MILKEIKKNKRKQNNMIYSQKNVSAKNSIVSHWNNLTIAKNTLDQQILTKLKLIEGNRFITVTCIKA